MAHHHSAGLFAVVPALDAGPTIADVVRGTLRHLPRVLVVDDGSRDDTAARAREAGAEVHRHASNLGKGEALRTAFEALLHEPCAAGAWPGPPWEAVLTLDADGQHDPDDIPGLVALFRSTRPAIIVGSRAAAFGKMWAPRRAMNHFSSDALRFFSGVELPDSQCGFRLYSRTFLEMFRPRGRRYEAEMEALMQAAALGLPIATLPIHVRVPDGRITSHYRPLADTFRIVGAVLGHWGRTRLRRGA
jgi:glycosyltransferase involved in cell wall biosynthesis